jgi:ubiquinone/menaquinone biosynthesis C-methylase UbiE
MLRRFLAAQFARPSGPVGRFVIGPWLDRIGRETNRLAFECLDLQHRDRVLEVGFGGGALLGRVLGATSGEVFGLDHSEAMVARAQRRFCRQVEKGRLRLWTGSAESIPLPHGSIHKAVSVDSLYFWSNPQAVLAELARLVRPGGLLVLCFEAPEEVRKWPGHVHGFRLHEEGEIRALMEVAGFSDFQTREGTGRKPDRFLCLSGRRLDANA